MPVIMKLELLVVSVLAVLVPYVAAQGDMMSMLQMMGYDVPSVRLPPKPPQTLMTYYQQQQQQKQSTYQQLLLQKQQQLKEAQQQQRLQQELELLNRLRSMAPAEVEALKKKLTPEQLQQLVQRIKYLQQLEQQQKQQGGAAGGTASNLILSGANRIRAASDPNAVSGGSTSSSSSSTGGSLPKLVTGPSPSSPANPVSAAMSRRAQYINAMLTAVKQRMAASQKNNPLEMMRKYQSFQKKARGAIGAGCNYPMATEGSMETFMAFSGGGCAAGGAVCMMNGQSCVDVGMSIMCCPPGYTGSTLDMMSYMRQMESFMGQFA